MAKSDKKEKKDKKEKRDKKDKKDRKRKRGDNSDDDDQGYRIAEKLAERVTKHLQKGTTQAYADDEGGLHLANRFVWKKKIAKDIQEGATVKEVTAKVKSSGELDRQAEIEKVRLRRAEAEREKQQREEEQEQLARDRAAAEAVELEEKEEEFHLENAKARAKQRLEDGRGEAIDMLVRDLMLGDLFDVGAEPPYHIFEGLTLAEMRDLHEELEEYQGMDNKEQEHRDWWAALLTVCEVELTEAIRQDEIDRARHRGEPPPASAMRPREAGVHASVEQDIHAFLAGKTHSQLEALEASIQEELETGDAADPDYYAAVLRRLGLHKAKARLREIHAGLLHRSLNAGTQKLDVSKEMGWGDEEEAVAIKEEVEAAAPAADLKVGRSPSPLPAPSQPAPTAREESEDEGHESNIGQWSPEPLDQAQIAGRDVIPEEDDLRMLKLLRAQVQQRMAASFGAAAMAASTSGGLSEADRAYHEAVANPSRGSSHPMLRNLTDAAPQQGEVAIRSGHHPEPDDVETRMFKASANRAMGDINEAGDAPFGGEVQLEAKVYWWHDKYRPRKPKYFNRVHTGYEWNKYNQTHYDHDNPPPKVVQGYKFNIFYPDLIDKSQAPEYTLEPDPEADEQGSTCLLRFHAGPPYEDLTFRILNREIEYSHKKGFKSTFDRGILALYFSFKRQRYRR